MTDISPSDLTDLIRRLGSNRRIAGAAEVGRLRASFAWHVLPRRPTARVVTKYDKHVLTDNQWPADTGPEGFLESLRETILDERGGVYLAMGLGRGCVDGVLRRSRPSPMAGARYAGRRVVILFNGEALVWTTGFQADEGDAYVEQHDGFWLRRPG